MIDYIDSPVPYIIGISETIWNKIVMTKWHEVADDAVAFYIDTALLMSKLDIPNNPEPMSTTLISTLNDILSKQSTLSERECKIYLKQAFYNYILLLINDVRIFRKERIHVKDDL